MKRMGNPGIWKKTDRTGNAVFATAAGGGGRARHAVKS